MAETATESDTVVATLDNGVRVVVIRLPHVDSACASVFVRTGSRNETRRQAGISHFVEHMAFKGTHERDCQRINLDAERLGADVNAHTDKDHTAYHMRGRARDAERFVQMLGDIVRNPSFPAAELERERSVLLHEFVEDDDDALATAFKLFDQAAFGMHPMAQPVIGSRRNIERFARDELVDYVQRQYTGANTVVGVAGSVDPQALLAAAEAAFGSMPRGSVNAVAAPEHLGGVRARRLAGGPQTHVVLGYPIPALVDDHHAAVVAAALFGEGMSSPLMDRIRERLGLVYYAACSADVIDVCGQFVIEASTSPEQLDEFFDEVVRLLAEHAATIDGVALERARNQLAVRALRTHERAERRLEQAALDLFAFDRVRSRAETLSRIDAVGADDVRDAFARMLQARPALALAGKLGKGPAARYLERVEARAQRSAASAGA